MRISCTDFIVKTVQIQRSAFFESMGHTMRISCTHFVVKIVQIPRSVGVTAMGHTSVFPIAGKTISGRSCAIFTTKSPFYRQIAVDATRGVFRGDGLYLRYCPLRRKRLAAGVVLFSR